jgi:hypothetical protein
MTEALTQPLLFCPDFLEADMIKRRSFLTALTGLFVVPAVLKGSTPRVDPSVVVDRVPVTPLPPAGWPQRAVRWFTDELGRQLADMRPQLDPALDRTLPYTPSEAVQINIAARDGARTGPALGPSAMGNQRLTPWSTEDDIRYAARHVAEACRREGLTRFGHLPLPSGMYAVERCSSQSLGVSVRLCVNYDISADMQALRFDVLGARG